jgi:hypothetical protein
VDDFEADDEERYLLAGLNDGRVNESIRERIRSQWRQTPPEQRWDHLQDLRLIASYAEGIFRSEAYRASGDMRKWFDLENKPLDDILALAKAAREAAQSSQVDDEAYEAETERQHRMWDLEEQGYFGRTVEFDPNSGDWIFVRFGELPKDKRSVFGLGLSDAEDTQGGWKQESGNMTHEAGICVFRAHAHPGLPGAYVLMDPHYDLARYDVGGQTRHLLGIIPQADSLDEIKAVIINGHLKTSKARDGSLRCELGSDGEYLIDGFKPVVSTLVPLENIWVSNNVSVADFLREYRQFENEMTASPGL